MTRPSFQFIARRVAIALFWAALLLTFLIAIGEAPSRLVWEDQDKLEHFGAFFILMVLGVFAYPRRALATTGMALLAFGVLIEVAQATPFVHRDADLYDVLADGSGLALAASLLAITGLRFRLLRLLRPTPPFVHAVHGR